MRESRELALEAPPLIYLLIFLKENLISYRVPLMFFLIRC